MKREDYVDSIINRECVKRGVSVCLLSDLDDDDRDFLVDYTLLLTKGLEYSRKEDIEVALDGILSCHYSNVSCMLIDVVPYSVKGDYSVGVCTAVIKVRDKNILLFNKIVREYGYEAKQ